MSKIKKATLRRVWIVLSVLVAIVAAFLLSHYVSRNLQGENAIVHIAE